MPLRLNDAATLQVFLATWAVMGLEPTVVRTILEKAHLDPDQVEVIVTEYSKRLGP